MCAVARDLHFPFRVFAMLAAVLFGIRYGAPAGRMRAFLQPKISHDDYLSLTASRPYPRQREYPHPPPPSKNNTTRTINMVDISFLPRLDAVQLGGHATRVGNTVEPEVSARCLSKSCRPRMQEVLEIGPARSNPPHGSCARFAQHSKRGQVEVSGVPYGRADSLHYRRRSARFTGL
jgi:hypothetical protein